MFENIWEHFLGSFFYQTSLCLRQNHVNMMEQNLSKNYLISSNKTNKIVRTFAPAGLLEQCYVTILSEMLLEIEYIGSSAVFFFYFKAGNS